LPELAGAEFPSQYLGCYEATLITILKYMGLRDETPLMGTLASFVLWEDALSVSPRLNRLEDEWERIHGLRIQSLPITSEAELRDKLVAQLDAGRPVCLPVDLYFLPHTPYYEYLHDYHYVAIFGSDDRRYFMVCPYYRFKGWVDVDVVHAGFFSAVIRHRYLIVAPELTLKPLPLERVFDVIQENCDAMLGRTTLAVAPQQRHGLSGIRAFSALLVNLLGRQDQAALRPVLLNMSRQLLEVSYSRYWFHRLIQVEQEEWLPLDKVDKLHQQFEETVQAWRAVGLTLGAGIHGEHAGMEDQVARQLDHVYKQEERLFNHLLAALPHYEGGRL
jgi:hypothetical protein